MKRGQERVVSGRVFLYDRSAGMPGTRHQYNFVSMGGYSPTAITGTPCDDTTKGTLKLYVLDKLPGSGQPVMIMQGTTMVLASGLPLRIFVTQDGLEPYIVHNGTKDAGTYLFRRVFTFANAGDEIVDEWEETWN